MQRNTFHTVKDDYSEQDLIKKILSGEKELFRVLIRKNNLLLHRVIRSYLNNNQEVEDAMQNTYVKAYEKLFQFNGEAQFSTWLIRIGINTAIKALKDRERFSKVHDPDEFENSNNLNQYPDSLDKNPENLKIREEVRETVEKAIDNLPQKYRTVYVLHEIERLSVPEISDATGLSAVNIRVRLHRAKTLLKSDLGHIAVNEIYGFGDERCDNMINRVMLMFEHTFIV